MMTIEKSIVKNGVKMDITFNTVSDCKAVVDGVEYTTQNYGKIHNYTWESTASGIKMYLASNDNKVIHVYKKDLVK